VKSFAAGRAESFAAEGATELAQNWAKTAEWAGERLEVLEKVKAAGTVITIAISAVKIISAISKGDWAGALKEAASTGLGLAVSAAAGTAGTAMLAGITVIVAAEMEGISGAAAMIRYAHESNQREAALDFHAPCTSG